MVETAVVRLRHLDLIVLRRRLLWLLRLFRLALLDWLQCLAQAARLLLVELHDTLTDKLCEALRIQRHE